MLLHGQIVGRFRQRLQCGHFCFCETAVTLNLVPLTTPQTVPYAHLDEAELTRLATIVTEGCSFGAFSGENLVGVAIGGVEAWNKSLRVWEFHVAESFRGQGIGRRLMEKMVETAVS